MKRTTSLYQFFKKTAIRVAVSIVLLLNVSVAFSQEDSTEEFVSPVVDTAASMNNYENVEEEQYNYYDHLLYWPADSFVIREVPDSVTAALKSQDAFWYADKDFKKKYIEPGKQTGLNWLISQKWFRSLIWIIIIGGFAAVLIWFLINSNVRIFGKKVRIISTDDQLTDNIFEINYAEEINKAMQNGNYRLATRLLFLRLLKNLADKNLINYQEDATNFDYLLQLNKSVYYKDFFKVTRYYEYAWYGGFDVSEDLYRTIKKDFDSIDAHLMRN